MDFKVICYMKLLYEVMLYAVNILYTTVFRFNNIPGSRILLKITKSNHLKFFIKSNS